MVSSDTTRFSVVVLHLQPNPTLKQRTDTTRFSVVVLHLQPNPTRWKTAPTPHALASWSFNFRLTRPRMETPPRHHKGISGWSIGSRGKVTPFHSFAATGSPRLLTLLPEGLMHGSGRSETVEWRGLIRRFDGPPNCRFSPFHSFYATHVVPGG